MITHSIPDMAKTALIGTVPSPKVGGMCKPVHCKHCSVNNKSGSDNCLAMRSEYTFSLKSPSNMMLESVCFQMTSWVINCTKNIVRAGRKLPQALEYCSCCSHTMVPAEADEFEPEGW